ncbi:rod-determining factor RdfA [Haloglomus litoreum]|uniref:rod-determining factor RdfA n=1 Tax=Haloglomus litoreum TaxID=3034026 RepID=UPI0023E764DE|nr:rod-determining factor RdfA [Haloglomus sp. DT116]
MSDSGNDAAGTSRRSKVQRLIDQYELGDYGAQLERAWTAGEDRRSLRQLADEFNVRILATKLVDAGAEPLEGEATNMYRLLTEDDVSSGVRRQTEARLEQHGLDPATVREEFVSHTSIHTYLTKWRDASPPTDDADRGPTVRDRINRLETRLTAVAEQGIDSLENAGEVRVGDMDVIVETRAHCRGCGRRYRVGELLERGGCHCGPA